MVELAEDGICMDAPPDTWYKDPVRMAAAMSLATEEHLDYIRKLEPSYAGRPDEYLQAVAEYLVKQIGRRPIDLIYFWMRTGTLSWIKPNS